MAADEAIVLAGGFGTRLRGIVDDVPKPLAPVAGRPFLAWLLDRLAASGIRRCILATGYMSDVIEESIVRLAVLKPARADDIRHAGHSIVAFSQEAANGDKEIKSYLRKNVYRHEKVMRVMNSAEDIIRRLFARYQSDPEALPEGWRVDAADLDEPRRARAIADFLAGMTDRYALREYQRLFDAPAELG